MIIVQEYNSKLRYQLIKYKTSYSSIKMNLLVAVVLAARAAVVEH